MPAPLDSRRRRIVRRTCLVVAAISGGWALALAVAGGIETTVLGMSLSSNDPLRPLLLASIGLASYILGGGDAWPTVASLTAVLTSVTAAIARVNPGLVAAALALITTVTGLLYMSTVGGGSDSYGYVSQADLWLSGSLKVREPWADAAPWPMKRWTFAPLGYRPIDENGVTVMVPTYAPGLPLLMAAVKALFGHAAMFWIVPLAGGLLVWVTFGIGCRLGTRAAGLAGAWLVATSPAVINMLFFPMSDVPAAAAWAVAFYFLCGRSHGSAVAAGAASAVAILIRPNLVMLAGPLGLWYLVRAVDDRSARRMWMTRAALYAAAAAPGIVVTAAINQYLNGSPTASGYGDLSAYFSLDHVGPNVRLYLTWLAQSHSPVALAGLVAILVPLRRFWPGVTDRWLLVVMALFTVLLWGQYVAYLVFEVWWYLRFMLPSWPFLMLGAASLLLSVGVPARPRLRAGAITLILFMGAWGFNTAVREQLFGIWNGERRYVGAAKLAEKYLPEQAVIFTMQHSGSLRYYSGRFMARYDYMDDGWMDRAVAWFAGQGLRVFLLIDSWELADVRKQFAAEPGVMAVVTRPPAFVYRDVLVFDLERPFEAEAPVTIFDTFGSLRDVPPAPRLEILPR